ncbi:NAD(P)/FAD-dependent oxidoreductase [Ilumatobacteraceae bacterium]|nr:NAD(P)/FAD-dependent oxidoreductase [Ilumatobacteraceae bacterium]
MAGDPNDRHDAEISSADVVVVGAGHNGLIAAAYLARAGLQTVLVESRSSVGGCASTVTDLGARFNICNCDHTLIRAMPMLEELDLSNHGLRYLESEFSMINANHDDHSSWVFHHDVEAHLDDLNRTHPAWVGPYRRYLKDALPVAELALAVARKPPTTRGILAEASRLRGRGAARLLRWSRLSAFEVLNQYFDDWRTWMPAVATGPTVWGANPSAPGTGLAALGYATRHLVRTGRPVGGSGALTDALSRSFESAGGTTLLGSRVERLDLEGGRVAGVRLVGGHRIRTGRVIAACDPQRVFHEWIDDTSGVSKTVERWRALPTHDGYESKLDVVLQQRPVFRHEARLTELLGRAIDVHSPTTVIAPSPNDLAQAHSLKPTGGVATQPTMLVNIPSVLDPSMQLNPAEHVLSLEVLFTPYIHEWSVSKEPERWLALLDGLCEPGTLKVDRWRAMTPDRYEREFGMHRGHTPAFSGPPLESFLGRQPALTRSASEIGGLHLSGAATFPGAGILGAAGRNSALRVLHELKHG